MEIVGIRPTNWELFKVGYLTEQARLMHCRGLARSVKLGQLNFNKVK